MLSKAANAVLIASILSGASVAAAQTLNLSALKCKQFIAMPKETNIAITIWLDGYYTDQEETTVVDFDKLRAKTEKLAAFCAQNPRTGLMTAAEDVLEK